MVLENVKSTKSNKESKLDSNCLLNCAVINNVNPFNTVGNYHEKRLQDRLKCNSSGSDTTYDNIVRSSHDIFANKVLKDYFEEFGLKINGDVSDRQLYEQNTVSKSSIRSVHLSESVFHLSTESSNNSYDSYCRSLTSSYDMARYKNSFQNNVTLNKPVVINDYEYHNKNADNYPLKHMYDEEFVSKTMQKLARLRTIVKNLVTQRQKEKERETWNNYINELKSKHRYYSDEPTTIPPPYIPTESNQYERIDNYWDARCNLSEPCKKILISSCETCGKDATNEYDKIHLESKQPFSRNCYYYPISSYGRFTVLNKDMKQSSSISLTSIDAFNKRRRFMERCYGSKCKTKPTKTLNLKSRGVGTERSNQEHKKKLTSTTYPTEKIIQTDDKKVTLDEIERKLDIMLKTFDLAMTEMREQKVANEKICPITKSQSISCSLKSSPDLNMLKKESNKVLFDTVLHNNDKNITVSEVGTSTVESKERERNIISEILEEEKKKSEQLKQDLKTLLYAKCYNQHSEEIQFDIPTKEISTVITNSRIRTVSPEQEVQVEMIKSLIDKEECSEQIAIAVNTEPLGLLALLQVSSVTIKQLLSYMGNLNYNYLSMLQLPRYSSPEHYECNICGGMFGGQAELSNHVQNHLENKRDYGGCCNMLSSRSQPGGLFHCKYCGLKFTRAYCCELHQHDCAKRFKKTHEIQTSLMLLR